MSEAPIDAVSAVNPVPLESCVPYTRFPPQTCANTYSHGDYTYPPSVYMHIDVASSGKSNTLCFSYVGSTNQLLI